MKKIISILMILVIAVVSLTACSVDSAPQEPVDGTLYENYEAVKDNDGRDKLSDESITYFSSIHFVFGEEISNDGTYKVVETEVTIPDWTSVLGAAYEIYAAGSSLEFYEILYDIIEAELYTYTETYDLTFELINGQWKIIPNTTYDTAIGSDVFDEY